MIITKELLQEHNACSDGLKWFNARFPDGCDLDNMDFGKLRDCSTNYIWWFYDNIERDDRLLLLCGVNSSSGVRWSDGVNRSYGVSASDGVSESCGVNTSNGVSRSGGVNASDGVNRSRGVSASDGVSESFGVNQSFGILDCFGVDSALFLANKPRVYSIFAVEVNGERYSGVWGELYEKLNGWVPTFNNIKTLYLKSGNSWKDTPIDKAEEIQKEEAWADMPKAAIDYIASLPEFDADMFFKITGIKVGGLEND